MVDRALRFDLLGRDKTLGRTLTQAEGRMARFGRTMGRVSLVGAAALGGLGVAAATMGIKTLASLENAQIGFAQLLGSGRKAQRFIADLKAFARKTPFELPGLVEAARGLLGAGAAADKVIPSLRAWGDAAGALGLDQERFRRVMLALTQAMNKGKLQADDLRQITEAGIPIWRILARALGKPVAEIRKMSEHGELLADTVLPKLEKQMGKDYGGAMAKQSKTLTGLWSTLMDTINIGLADTLLPFQDAIKGGLTAAIKGFGLAFSAIPKAVNSVFGKGGALANIDLGKTVKELERLSEPFRSAAKGWTNAIVGGVKEGLRTGDWRDLGGILGNVLSRVIGNGSDLLKRAFAGVDWVDVGKTIGGQAFGFAVGFVSALGGDFLQVAKEHPLDLAIFFTSFLAIGKAAGPLLKIVERIPILRSFVGPLLRMIESASAPFRAAGSKLFRFLGDGFLEGLERSMPRTVKFLRRVIGDVGAWLALRAEQFRKSGSGLIRNLAGGIGETVGLVVRDIGRVTKAITRPFVGSASWLIRRGSDAISGLIRGIGSMLSPMVSKLGELKRRLLSPFASAASWLYHKGVSIVGGLITGARSMLGSVGNFVVDLKNAIVGGIKRLFHISSPSRVMMGLGVHMVQGLVRGLVTSQSGLQGILKSMGGDVMEAFGGIGGGSARGLVGLAKLAFGAFRNMFPGMVIGGWRAHGSVPGSDHPKGKALDLMTSNGAVAALIISVFRSMLGAKYWIWNRTIAQADQGWKPHAYHGPNPHTDHVHLSFFKRGGIADRATAGIFGEAGPEALIPLDRAREFGLGGGPSIVVNLHFHGPVVGGPGAADHLADLIVDALRRKKRNLGGIALGIA